MSALIYKNDPGSSLPSNMMIHMIQKIIKLSDISQNLPRVGKIKNNIQNDPQAPTV